MSKGLSFALGVLTGIILTIGALFVIYYTANPNGGKGETTQEKAKLPDGVTMLDEPVPFTDATSFEVLQVVFEDAALARSGKYTYGSMYYSDPIVLILSDQKNSFYDDQIVKTSKDCRVMRVGTYNYQTKMGWKTVPIISFVKAQ